MNVMARIFITIMSLILISISAAAVNPDDILGVWLNQDKDGKIEIYKCGDKYCGKIVWMSQPDYPPGSKDGIPGTPRRDHKNSNPELRQRPIQDLVFMRDFSFSGDNVWKGGEVYDPKSGHTYHGKITMISPHELKLRGYVGISLFGRTDVWTR